MKVLSICGSPRKGNSEAILLKLQDLFSARGIENEIVLLREKNIERCHGCVEYCNRKLDCRLKDDFEEIKKKIEEADAYIFSCPNYFQMPPGIFKDFIDRCSIFYTAGFDFSQKKAAVVCVGADEPSKTDICLNIIVNNFCKTLGLPVVFQKSFQGKSELGGNFQDIFENGFNPKIETDLHQLVAKLAG